MSYEKMNTQEDQASMLEASTAPPCSFFSSRLHLVSTEVVHQVLFFLNNHLDVAFLQILLISITQIPPAS